VNFTPLAVPGLKDSPDMTQIEVFDPITLATFAAPGLRAVRRFWRAFVLIQACALMLVLTYFHSTTVRHACETVSRLHEKGGLLLSAIAAAIAGGIIPEIAKAILPPKSLPSEITGQTRGHLLSRGDLFFTIIAFAINGVITDLQYRMLSWAIGSDPSFLTAVKKMLADQFVTTPLYGVVYWAVIYRWKALGFRLMPLLREVGPQWYLRHVGRLLVTAWCFWIPMVLMVYLMPPDLQFSLFCIVLAAWSLLMVFVTSEPQT
jgi:hypothetical protein